MNTNDNDYEAIVKKLRTLKRFNDNHPRPNRTRQIERLQELLNALRK
jgi:hypothetical protein